MFRSSLAALARTVALTVVLGGALSACGADGPDPDAPATPSASGTATESPSASVTPTQVSFGDAESVTWAPTGDLSSELSIRVEAVREGRFADFKGLVASGITEDNQPYYVDVTIGNEGDAELGGLDVPLYLADSSETLSPPSKFAKPFAPCASEPLPESFGAGEEAQLCLVFVAAPDAVLESVTFQPTLERPAISWIGEVDVPMQKPTPKQKRR